ncbi:hypothetical protein FDK21_19850 [Cohaesibacter sp. CAU 1516]|uniref:hypothetical protein n=1 Tax=Cohaesibacter sp. CAU 1516 TaxID=2576038 RepID=UPI0010FD05F6|nr:hypothetical protein [Cohaesibacter sp. CAU 1516]TLP42338.1 hypothetical protein FDK21_19850 [Cohaesibacter sp. CAU 1516]
MLIKDDNHISNTEINPKQKEDNTITDIHLFTCWILSDNTIIHKTILQNLRNIGFGSVRTIWIPRNKFFSFFCNSVSNTLLPDTIIGVGESANIKVNKIKRQNPSVFSVQFLSKPKMAARHDLNIVYEKPSSATGKELKYSIQDSEVEMNAEECCNAIHSHFWARQKLFQNWHADLGSPSVEL